jgi:hypothetical protein
VALTAMICSSTIPVQVVDMAAMKTWPREGLGGGLPMPFSDAKISCASSLGSRRKIFRCAIYTRKSTELPKSFKVSITSLSAELIPGDRERRFVP